MALGRESISVSTESLTSSALSLNSGASPRKLASPAPEGNASDSSSGARRKTQKATKLKKKGTYYITDLLNMCTSDLSYQDSEYFTQA